MYPFRRYVKYHIALRPGRASRLRPQKARVRIIVSADHAAAHDQDPRRCRHARPPGSARPDRRTGA